MPSAPQPRTEMPVCGECHLRSAATPYDSQVWSAPLILASSASVNSNSLAAIERAAFQSMCSSPATILRRKFDRFFLAGVERDPILHTPNGANGTHVCPLNAHERKQVQTLGVVQHQF